MSKQILFILDWYPTKTNNGCVFAKHLICAIADMGYECVEPGGAFYLFPKALEEDANAFCEKAKKYDLLLVPSDSFGCPGHVRISYCVEPERIKRALPLFKKLIDEYKGEK